jgi:hypothetical protein
MKQSLSHLLFSAVILLAVSACKGGRNAPGSAAINAMDLKRGKVVLCGPPGQELGTVAFTASCSETAAQDFNLAISLLHSFEYDEAEKVFAKIIDTEPSCAMAYWGVAMCNFHPLWTAPSQAELEKGARAVAIAQSLEKPAMADAYIKAIAVFYQDWQNTSHITRCLRFEQAMEQIYRAYPNDMEAAIFYALALNGAADLKDTTFSKQKKAGRLLSALQPRAPRHPGIIHYIIHSYDYPALAAQALPAARKYASIAPASAHAQHMPSHIFTRLGLWEEGVRANLSSTDAARCYAANNGIKGHWDEELHGLDYLVYAYLQQGDNAQAGKQYDYLRSIREVQPMTFKVAYAFAAIPSRWLIENRLWKEAAELQAYPANLPWEQFPWQRGIIHFTRLLGAVHSGQPALAKAELENLHGIHDTLVAQKDTYKSTQLEIQVKAGEAWILFREGKQEAAIALMQQAADMEDQTAKHPVSPGEVAPARELLGDMLLEMERPDLALAAYEADLKERPGRFNGLYGAGLAAERAHQREKAAAYYQALTKSAAHSDRPELKTARIFLAQQNRVLAQHHPR